MGFPIHITDASCISSLGMGMAQHREALLCGKVALSRAHRFGALIDAPLGCVDFTDLNQSGAFSSASSDDLIWLMITRVIEDIAARNELFERYQAEEIGVFIGTTTYGAASTIEGAKVGSVLEFSRRLSAHMQNSAILSRIRAHYPVRGFSLCFSNSCASSAMAIGEAARGLSSGLFKVVLAGGFDVLTPLSVMGFDALQVLNHDFSEPLTGRTEGINLGEGGGFLLLEKEDRALKAPMGRVIGYAAGNEAFHPVKPNPDGSGIMRVMQGALDDAGVRAGDINYVNAHGTGTLSNDESESAAITAMFGRRRIAHSTKRWHGHTLGASGALEAQICLLALGELSEWCTHYGLDAPASAHGLAMSNSFGFGGANASLIFGK